MFVTYTPDGDLGQRRQWEFVPGALRESRAEMIERRYSGLLGAPKSLDEFASDVLRGVAAARRVLLWHLQSLDHPTLRIEDVDYARRDLTVEASREELLEMRATISKARGMDEAQREQILAAIDGELDTIDERERTEEVAQLGKAD